MDDCISKIALNVIVHFEFDLLMHITKTLINNDFRI